MKRKIVAVSGFTSNSGKTSLMCELLRALPGWEAIKMTRGHYRSCGKDPHACCVSHLLGDKPLIRSGLAETYEAGKDTGRYWDAGASNVHWAVVTDGQVERGIREALSRVNAPGVMVEGTSFLDYVEADFVVMTARSSGAKIKSSAQRALPKASALYLFGDEEIHESRRRESFLNMYHQAGHGEAAARIPLYTRETLDLLVSRVMDVESMRDALFDQPNTSAGG